MVATAEKPVSVREFCDKTGLPLATVYDQIRRKSLPHSRVGQRILIPHWVLEGKLRGDVGVPDAPTPVGAMASR